MNITYRQMQKEDIAKVAPLFIEYWNGTGDEWTPELVFYDLTAYNLVEIIVASEYQKSGIGTKMMAELERRVKEMGAAMVQLVSV